MNSFLDYGLTAASKRELDAVNASLRQRGQAIMETDLEQQLENLRRQIEEKDARIASLTEDLRLAGKSCEIATRTVEQLNAKVVLLREKFGLFDLLQECAGRVTSDGGIVYLWVFEDGSGRVFSTPDTNATARELFDFDGKGDLIERLAAHNKTK